MTYIYVLSLRNDNLFFQMTVISATLLRKSHPSDNIVIAVDEHTDLQQYPVEYNLLLKLDVEIVVVETGYLECVLSSRFIKLSLTAIINDDFWYLDSDTLPLPRVDIPGFIGDIGLVRDLNANEAGYVLGENRVANCRVMKWPIPKYPYYNSGVIFAKNNMRVKNVFDYAKTLWLAACEEGERCGDQLPLNIALQQDSDARIITLDDSYNAQIRAAPKLAPTAKIIHIFSGSIKKHNDTVLHTMIASLQQDSVLRVDIIDKLLRTGNPWVKGTRQARLFPVHKILSRMAHIFGY